VGGVSQKNLVYVLVFPYIYNMGDDKKVTGRDGSTYKVDKMAVINDPVRNTQQFSNTPMYKGQHESTHLMADDNKNTAWPTLFQDEGGNWFEGGYKEAERTGETYKFNTKEEMINFAREGDWKLENKQHGGNHLEGTNYGLSSNRYSTKGQKYRRFKKGGQVLDVYSSKGEVKPSESYNGPYKDMELTNFFDWNTQQFKKNSQGVSFNNDSEYKKWRSKDRGYSGDDLIKFYMFTQMNIPTDGSVKFGDASTWKDKNYGNIRTPITDPVTGDIMTKGDGQPFFNEFNEGMHQNYLDRKNAGDPSASWYPSSQKEAFGMARDLGLSSFFYNGEPVYAQTKEEQIEYQKETGEFYEKNITPQLSKVLEFADDDSEIDFSTLTRESMIYLQNNPETVQHLKPRMKQDFKTQKEALEFFNQTKDMNFFGKGATVNGEPLFLHNYESTGNVDDNLTSMIYDVNLSKALLDAQSEYRLTVGAPRQAQDKTRIDGFKEEPQMTFEEFWPSWMQKNEYSPKYESLANAKESDLKNIIEYQGGSAFEGSSSNPMPATNYNGRGGSRTFTIGDKQVSNPYHSYDGTPIEMGSIVGDVALAVTGIGALRLPSMMKSGFNATKGFFTNPGKYGTFGAVGNTLVQPLKYADKVYTNSMFNKYIGAPTMSGTANMVSVNNLTNVAFAGMSGDAAITDFSEGNYGMGALNLGFAGLNAFNPYKKLQTGLNKIPNLNAGSKLKTPSGYSVSITDDLVGLNQQAQKLPAFSLRNSTGLGQRQFTAKDYQKNFMGALDEVDYINNDLSTMNKFLPQ
tara:strand:+ start:754 stop:3147 length:2394 start_codon:yes stop_codon:yes gene_type:complete